MPHLLNYFLIKNKLNTPFDEIYITYRFINRNSLPNHIYHNNVLHINKNPRLIYDNLQIDDNPWGVDNESLLNLINPNPKTFFDYELFNFINLNISFVNLKLDSFILDVLLFTLLFKLYCFDFRKSSIEDLRKYVPVSRLRRRSDVSRPMAPT